MVFLDISKVVGVLLKKTFHPTNTRVELMVCVGSDWLNFHRH